MDRPTHFIPFSTPVEGIALPEKFTFPFFYEPHALSRIAAKELQAYLTHQTDFDHNFGLNENKSGAVIGKMFGVLVVQTSSGDLGQLWAFSGKLADQNHWPKFVPTVYDMLTEKGYFKKEELVLNALNEKIAQKETSPEGLEAQANASLLINQASKAIADYKKMQKQNKQRRADFRTNNPTLSEEVVQQLIQESQLENIRLRHLQLEWKAKIATAQATFHRWEQEIEALKEERRQRSAQLQNQLFSEYAFLNRYGVTKNLLDLFEGNPPAGAGECAAPKLLHYAFQQQLTPLAMAEFWWGQSPKSEIRKHQQFYPACTGKCAPILSHMLEGIPLEDNPFLVNEGQTKTLEIIYEDAYLMVINKPESLLSTPGKNISDSVYTRIKAKYPEATGPLLVHRLDQATSGLLLIAKTQEIHKKLQYQFISRKIEKKYIAVLEGVPQNSEGTIDLPLRVDLDNRPYQIVCETYGKPATTYWKILQKDEKNVVVELQPVTGRTHQLRVHAAHPGGLNCPIKGDDLYGTKADRLFLHAFEISFWHPIHKCGITVKSEPDFFNI
ncbi:RluA family pseudouridine synthase [Flavobacterium sp.]|jgi:tRNA pseudouridine32 synthase/23S rRNA pseudouridine746 synthase|uniref:RluA family pseudouridine synthase n=2 Tax=Flavobacterium sp. TaxID=239 RepID=UPI0022C5022F|nr:RluA family pseudouridine synthase [Flavobacterium sp.]MCZ8144984.1 pseudouridine synthase [Flavobacterium sp.]MCZ8368266.1 pseudouridine synthase [Flavobacterium sp.]